MANIQNLKPFKKGNKGGGRPKGSVSIVKILQKMLNEKITIPKDPLTKTQSTRQIKEAIALALLGRAMKGDVPAIKEILERIDGKTVQINEHTGKNGKPIETKNAVTIYIPSNGRD